MRKILVESLEWRPYTTIIRKESVVKGAVMYPYGKGKLGGYRGEGKWDASATNPHYRHWMSLFIRCYKSSDEWQPTYQDCEISEEWHNLQNFCDWSVDNFPKDTFGMKWELDKDLLVKGNKTYGPATCCYLPKELNLFLARVDDVAIYEYTTTDNRILYRVWVRQGKKTVGDNNHYVGSYPSYEEALIVWGEKKKQRHTALCEKYKDILPTDVYTAFKNLDIF